MLTKKFTMIRITMNNNNNDLDFVDLDLLFVQVCCSLLQHCKEW